jgi:hypothetical protein
MSRWSRDEALKWAENFGPLEGQLPSGNAMALASLALEVHRLRGRVESLRGLCKTAAGWLEDASCPDQAERVLALIGDMEKPL